ncbi:hypothetical protein SLS62_002897 [Diatrype stigma]|uniref:Dynamin-type G domain-containing protein n=1 Tax=Diatrype stigma TaxID=117547 RepID=A0AAN9UXG4_9PEZI
MTMAQSVQPQMRENASLQTQDGRDLIDIIDRLRSHGISRFVDLPQIVVCGDQSSGKSSVLEAISGVAFPAKDTLCTRFATELILRRNLEVDVKISILPDPSRPQAEKTKLENFTHAPETFDLSQVFNDANVAMGLDVNGKVFSADILRIEISGPSQPHLTMVDLPGLFLAGNKDQTAKDAELVKALVLDYMKRPRSIILAVVSAKSDFALQQVTQHSRNLDPHGIRTLGLITKPDTLDEGSDSERFYIELARNNDVKFSLGWHVLRNRGYATRHVSIQERDSAESEFLSSGLWKTLQPSQLGIASLRIRLSNVLKDQILHQLPCLISDVEKGVETCQTKLSKLRESRTTISEQRRYLLKISGEVTGLLNAAIDGIYTDAFFSSENHPEFYRRRLRAVVQNKLIQFADEMQSKGHAKIINEGTGPHATDSRNITRSDFIEQTKVLMRTSRGRELVGTYHPDIVGELFRLQCGPWKSLILDHSERIFESAYSIVGLTLQHVTDEETSRDLLREIIVPHMDKLKTNLITKIEEIMDPHLLNHPITYNHYLTENVQKIQAQRQRRRLEKQLNAFFEKSSISMSKANYTSEMASLLDALVASEPNMENYSASIAIDTMTAYYKVTNDHFLTILKLDPD